MAPAVPPAVPGPDAETDYLGLAVVVLVAGWLASGAYELVGLALGAGLGMLFGGLRVVDAGTLRRLGGRQVLVRWLVASSHQPTVWFLVQVGSHDARGQGLALVAAASVTWRFVLLVSTLGADDGRGLHDRWSGSRVVPASSVSTLT